MCLEPDSLSHSGEDLEEGVQFAVWVSFYEIYNEFLYDLLDISPSLQPRKRVTLRLSDDKQGNPYVKGEINSRLHINTYAHMCFKCATAASQSHLVFFFYLPCQISPGSRCAVLKRLGRFFELDIRTRALPALTSTKTPAVGRNTGLVLFSVCDSVEF